jgi:alpha-L-fucosidase
MAPMTNWSVYPPPETNAAERIWFPVECNTLLIGHEFWDGTPPRNLQALLNAYYTSVGRNSTLLLKAAANKQGRLSDETVKRLQEFHAARQQIFGADFAAGKTATASNVRGGDGDYGPARLLDGDPNTYWASEDAATRADLEVDLGAEREFNVVRIEEMISLGQRVAEYRLDVWDAAAGDWKQVNRGFTIGHRKLDRFPTVKSSKVRLSILRSRGGAVIHSLGVHLDTVSAPESFLPENANAESRRPQPRPTN